VLSETRALVSLGYKEIVLSGINLGRWGRDFEGRTRFVDLLRAMLAETDIQKIRISSVEPMDWSDDLIELVASSRRICKHAHVPLQSGSDRILRRMHRKYRPWHYADRIQKIRRAMPTAAIGADVMVGFPGETAEQFEETRAFIDSLPFTYLHVFTYSSRPGTPSASMPEQVRGDVTRERNRILRELAARKKRVFQEQFIGRELETITLTNIENGRTEGLTDNFQKAWIEGQWDANRVVQVSIDGIHGEAMTGRVSS
jgi:threonylcarbamoyladenosine tRNA methylthiotransferase MtaB